MKEVAKECEGKYSCLGGNTGKGKTFPILMKIKEKRMQKKLPKPYPTNLNLLKK